MTDTTFPGVRVHFVRGANHKWEWEREALTNAICSGRFLQYIDNGNSWDGAYGSARHAKSEVFFVHDGSPSVAETYAEAKRHGGFMNSFRSPCSEDPRMCTETVMKCIETMRLHPNGALRNLVVLGGTVTLRAILAKAGLDVRAVRFGPSSGAVTVVDFPLSDKIKCFVHAFNDTRILETAPHRWGNCPYDEYVENIGPLEAKTETPPPVTSERRYTTSEYAQFLCSVIGH